MNIFTRFRGHITDIVNELVDKGEISGDLALDAVTAEPPRDSSHGDIATNAAMVLAKPTGKKPRDIADLLVAKINDIDDVVSAEVAGPGFINIRLNNSIWYDLLEQVLRQEEDFGDSDIGGNRAINVEYVSANPTGPMHIGHARGAVIGDATALLLAKAGYDVTKEYYINDAGSQIDTLTHSAYLRYREAAGEDIGEIPEGYYPGDYLITVGHSLFERHGDKYIGVAEDEWFPEVRRFTLDAMMATIRCDLLMMGIEHDIFSSEKKILDKGDIESTIAFLEKQGVVYEGVLEPPKGKKPDDWEPREQLLFRSTEYGDDVDRPLRKSDGTHTYFAADLAYHYDKLQRGFSEMVLALGYDHAGYVKRITAGVKAMSGEKGNISVLLYQLVNFMDKGKPMKMSKRSGTYITVKDVTEAVGKDVLRFIMLTRKHDAPLDFDLHKVKDQSRDNPVFYVQYAHARCCSVLRNAAEHDKTLFSEYFADKKEHFSLLQDEGELAVIKAMAEWPRIVEAAARTREPHRIAYYLQELAASFHALWNKGKEDEQLRFIVEHDTFLTIARLALVQACMNTLASGLGVLGVEPLREL